MKMWFIPLLFGLVALSLIGRRRAAAFEKSPDQLPQATGIPITISVESWRVLATSLGTPLAIPANVTLAWVQKESGGNPCSIGETVNPPQEYGIAQLYYPSDEAISSRANLRSACATSQVTNTEIAKMDRAQKARVRAELERLARPLTDAEKLAQMKATVGLIQKCRGAAGVYADRAKVKWGQPDRWKLVKLYHNLPVMVALLPDVTQKLGHPPASWDEYKRTVLAMNPAELDRYGKISGRLPYFGAYFASAERIGNSL